MKKIFILTWIVIVGLSFGGCATWNGVKEDSTKTWEVTKDISQDAWEVTREAIHEATAE